MNYNIKIEFLNFKEMEKGISQSCLVRISRMAKDVEYFRKCLSKEL